MKRTMIMLYSLAIAGCASLDAGDVDIGVVESASIVAGTISRSEAIARAKRWVDLGVMYSQDQSRAFGDGDGHTYRPDCSGMVSMAWHLPKKSDGWDFNTGNFGAYSGKTYIDYDDLRTGDAILGVSYGHIVLFDRWTDSSHTSMWIYQESATGTPANHVPRTRSWYVANGFRPIRYSKMIDDSPTANRTLVREPSGAIAVMAGGAQFDFWTMAELTEAGYANQPWISVPAGYLATLPTVPGNRTLLRDATSGALAVIAGAAAVGFATWDEYVAAGYEHAVFVNLAHRQFLAATQRTVPGDGTVLRNNTTGAMAVVAGGARFGFATWDEVIAAGYEHTLYINVPPRLLVSLPTTPVNRTLLRNNITGAIGVIAGGAAIGFATWDDYVAAGYEHSLFVNVPPHFLAELPTVPADRTLLRNNATGAIVVIAGDAKIGFATWDEVVAAGYGQTVWVNVPPAYLAGLPTMPRDGTLLRGTGSATVWRIIAGKRTAVTPAPGAVIVDVSPAALTVFPVA